MNVAHKSNLGIMIKRLLLNTKQCAEALLCQLQDSRGLLIGCSKDDEKLDVSAWLFKLRSISEQAVKELGLGALDSLVIFTSTKNLIIKRVGNNGAGSYLSLVIPRETPLSLAMITADNFSSNLTKILSVDDNLRNGGGNERIQV
jgi:predicted regulator of Ras-like GTPase activity (Roadblock/LC7/MglB family)